MSTISTGTAADLASAHARQGQRYVAAPVLGNPDAAKARQLFIVVAGVAADVERCRPLIDDLGRQTFVTGTDPGHANLIKLLGNMMTATALEVLGEVVAVALKRGLDPKPFIDILTGTMFGGRVHKIYGDKFTRQNYAPGFFMPLALKDVRLALAKAEKGGRSDAVGQRGAGSADHRNRTRLFQSRLDCARPDCCRGGGTPLGPAVAVN
jgi:3-hydroxyisobutyrate dehydrogenase-like beta-hydroxyacid dehydrogenase